jgi:hypothetical protein
LKRRRDAAAGQGPALHFGASSAVLFLGPPAGGLYLGSLFFVAYELIWYNEYRYKGKNILRTKIQYYE